MHAAVERGLELSSFWDAELRKELPEGADVFDAHTHLGDDIDGMKGRFDELLGIMDAYGVSRAFMFCMDEPDRHPGFQAANDRTLEAAERSAADSVRSFGAWNPGCRSGSSMQNMNAREKP